MLFNIRRYLTTLLGIPLHISFLAKICNDFKRCDANEEPCNLVGVSPSLLKVYSCFTGLFLTGHPRLLVHDNGIKSLTLMHALVVGVLRVEHPSSVYRTKDICITSFFLRFTPCFPQLCALQIYRSLEHFPKAFMNPLLECSYPQSTTSRGELTYV